MRIAVVLLIGATLLAGCAGGSFGTNTATMPQNQYGGPQMNQTEAIALASWALKNPQTTRNNPELAARALAAEDWLAGQTQLTGEFGIYAPANEVSWGIFRRQARAAIGVAPDASSQAMVDHLLATADALNRGQPDMATKQLSDPIFSAGPTQTLAALGNLPPLPGRDWAFYDLAINDNRNTGACHVPMAC